MGLIDIIAFQLSKSTVLMGKIRRQSLYMHSQGQIKLSSWTPLNFIGCSNDPKRLIPEGKKREPMEDDSGNITQSYPRLAAAILFCLIIGSLGSLVTTTGPNSWYASLQKPFFTPPGWVFAPVWITLFILMGIAVYLVWQRGTGNKDVQIALGIFGVQFVLNVLWSFLFFGLQSPLYGFIDIVILWILIVLTIRAFYHVKKSAAYVLIPYIGWVTLATLLNGAIYFMNR